MSAGKFKRGDTARVLNDCDEGCSEHHKAGDLVTIVRVSTTGSTVIDDDGQAWWPDELERVE